MSTLFASGDEWVGSGVRSIESALHELFTGARRRRLVASTYAIGGAAFDLPEEWIRTALDADAEVVLVVNRYDAQPRGAMRPIELLAGRFPRLKLFSYDGPERHDLHAKVVVADERLALIGSSNWSGNGLNRNHEMAVLVEGDPARRAADLVVRLSLSTYASVRP